jgi:hypothetical protein
MDDHLWSMFADKAGVGDSPTLVDLVEAVRAVPYGRPRDRTPAGVVSDWRGTCSTKHALLAEMTVMRWPGLEPGVVHRVYRLTPDLCRGLFGDRAVAAVPPEGVTDVHSYLTLSIKERRVRVDATFPGPRWDGVSDMPLSCGEGFDVEGGDDPNATKSSLVERYCDVAMRERVIEALAEGTGTATRV